MSTPQPLKRHRNSKFARKLSVKKDPMPTIDENLSDEVNSSSNGSLHDLPKIDSYSAQSSPLLKINHISDLNI